jgi:hypothetical protein
MIGLASPQDGYLDEAMRRRLLADVLMRQGNGSSAIGGFMPGRLVLWYLGWRPASDGFGFKFNIHSSALYGGKH